MPDIQSLLNSPQTVANQLLADQKNLINFLSGFIRRQSSTVYGGGLESAQAIIGAIGSNAITVFEASEALASLINEIAPSYGLQPIGDVMPNGYSMTPNNDGTVTISYTPPSSSSSSSNSNSNSSSSSSSITTTSSSSSGNTTSSSSSSNG